MQVDAVSRDIQTDCHEEWIWGIIGKVIKNRKVVCSKKHVHGINKVTRYMRTKECIVDTFGDGKKIDGECTIVKTWEEESEVIVK